FGLAYRLLGSRADAEDVLQDAWLRWQAVPLDDIREPEAWLVTVVTRLGIDRQRQLRARREDYAGPWLPEPLLDEAALNEKPVDGIRRNAEAILDLASDLSIAFLVTLERLSAE